MLNCYLKIKHSLITTYAVTHIEHLQQQDIEFPHMKWVTVNDWKTTMTTKMKQMHSGIKFELIMVLEGKKTGRPSTLPDELTKESKLYIQAIRGDIYCNCYCCCHRHTTEMRYSFISKQWRLYYIKVKLGQVFLHTWNAVGAHNDNMHLWFMF